MQLIGQSFPCVLALHGEHVFERLLLTSQDLNFLLVSVQVLVKLAAGLSQGSELALEVSCVLSATLHVADSGLRCDYEKTDELLRE